VVVLVLKVTELVAAVWVSWRAELIPEICPPVSCPTIIEVALVFTPLSVAGVPVVVPTPPAPTVLAPPTDPACELPVPPASWPITTEVDWAPARAAASTPPPEGVPVEVLDEAALAEAALTEEPRADVSPATDDCATACMMAVATGAAWLGELLVTELASEVAACERAVAEA
jgi:hypothetical protein